MRTLLICCVLVSWLYFSCSEKPQDQFVKGELAELIVGEFILYKDNETKYIYNLKTIPGQDNLVVLGTESPDKDGLVLKFYEIGSSDLVHQVIIPFEGPEALKGGRGGNVYIKNEHELFLVGNNGRVGLYDSLGKKIKEWEVDFNLPMNSSDFVRLETKKGLMTKLGDWIQVGLDPSNPMKNIDPKARLMSSEFPLDFSNWLSQINLKTGEVRYSDFLIPKGYEVFQGDMTSSMLFGAIDTKRGHYYLGWPYADTLYKLSNLELIEKMKPKTSIKFKFLPSEREAVGKSSTAWILPKEASRHIFLLYDENNDLFLRASKVKESGSGETKFDRTKHYVLQVFSGEWTPLKEYYFDWEGGVDLENWFLTGKGLFINQPEQTNEDEYGFYRIDLGRVKKEK